ncbi:MAG: phasin family protein [Gammaproteobacteria bacterium]
MQKEFIDQWASLGKSALESMKELGEINARIMEKMTEQQASILNTCLEASAKEIELVSAAKDPSELLAKQAALANEYNARFVEIVRATNDILTECKTELSQWAEKGMEKAVSPFTQSPAPKPKKA